MTSDSATLELRRLDTPDPAAATPTRGATPMPQSDTVLAGLPGGDVPPGALSAAARAIIDLDAKVNAPIYTSLPLVATRAEGCWIWDVDGRRYLDMMSAYSAVSFGHGHPRLLAALTDQAGRMAVTSRAIHSDRLAPFLEEVVRVTGLDRALPMNTGAEAVETAIKAARKWGTTVKGIPEGQAEIVVFDNNFHGRTTTLISFSSHDEYRAGFGPLTGGFVRIPYGDAKAAAAAITPRTCAILIEPIQGEGGVIVPPAGYFQSLRQLCDAHNILLIVDEIQTGLGRTGKMLAIDHEGVRPDGVCLGKALGGGLLPVSAFVGTEALMTVFSPGDHGSTFGGNALASRVGFEALRVLQEEGLAERSAVRGAQLMQRLTQAQQPGIADVRGRGLMIGLELIADIDAQAVVDRIAAVGIITKLTHRNTIRLSPPLTIGEADLAWAADQLLLAIQAEYVQRQGKPQSPLD